MVVSSCLDTDLYKISMQACIHKHFSDADVEYVLINRSTDVELTYEAVDWIRDQVMSWDKLRYQPDEIEYLKKELSYLPPAFFDFLPTVRLNPQEEVSIVYNGGSDLKVNVKGKWDIVMWYEVPILATISEAYFKFVDTDWDMEGQRELAMDKARRLVEAKCPFSEFGTRRRRSRDIQRLVAKAISDSVGPTSANPSPFFIGSSNVAIAREMGFKPVGTVAHELIMGVAAYDNDCINANQRSMEVWVDTVGPDHTGVALTDTYGTQYYLKNWKEPYLSYYTGVRQDSGDPEEFTAIISQFYKAKGIPPNQKRIIYSDALTVEKCLKYRDVAYKYGLVPAFGIGTYLTNDFHKKSDPSQKSVPLNIVIKLSKVNGNLAVKLSDNVGKNTGDAEEVKRVKELIGYSEEGLAIDENRRWD